VFRSRISFYTETEDVPGSVPINDFIGFMTCTKLSQYNPYTEFKYQINGKLYRMNNILNRMSCDKLTKLQKYIADRNDAVSVSMLDKII